MSWAASLRAVAERLAGKRALVTGASSGIGEAIALALAQRGANLVLVARREERLEALAQRLRADGVEVIVHAADLTRHDAADALFAATEGRDVQVDVIVNNAGVGRYDAFVDTPWESLEQTIALNLVALTKMTHLFTPKMVARGSGHVMNIASIGAYTPTPQFAVYTATKAYVRHLTEALDAELEGTGVRAICINPGGTTTEFTEQAGTEVTASGQRFMMSATECAEIAIDKMLAGRRNVVTGVMNALGMWTLRFLPRSMYPRLAAAAMSSSVKKT